MTQPTVCCICVTADRQALTDRAVRSFLTQDYRSKYLLIYDTGKIAFNPGAFDRDICLITSEATTGRSVGVLRNDANALITAGDIIVNFDSDDWSAPTRISDQVKLLVESGKQAVGYREMLFWKQAAPVFGESGNPTVDLMTHAVDSVMADHYGEAWLYRNTDPRYIVSTSACYWRKTWEDKPFDDVPTGEVSRWIKGLDTLGFSSLPECNCIPIGDSESHEWDCAVLEQDPKMLATIHSSNTIKQHIFPAATNPDGSLTWTRTPAWDARCRALLEAA